MSWGSRNSDNAQCAHIWAQQNELEGTAKGGNVFFKGATIYSYGYHFPMATICENVTILNRDSYSSTTSTHQSYVRQAISGNFVYANTEQLKRVIEYQNHIKHYDADTRKGQKQAEKIFRHSFAKDIAKDVIDHINYKLKEASGKKQARSQQKILDEAEQYYNNALTLLTALNIKMPVKAATRFKQLKENAVLLLQKYEKELAAAKKKYNKAERERLATVKIQRDAAIVKWLNQEKMDYSEQSLLRGSETVHMRVEGDEIVTTLQARFPVRDAVNALPTIEKCKREQLPVNFVGLSVAIRLGNFKIDSIDSNGNVKAGCHFIEWPQIEYVAKQLKLIN